MRTMNRQNKVKCQQCRLDGVPFRDFVRRNPPGLCALMTGGGYGPGVDRITC